MAKVTLEQWRMLQAVIEYGGFAQASEAMHKSQSTISYAVNKLQEQLGLSILEIKGRKARLTEVGHVMLRRSQVLLKEAEALERVANNLASGWEAVITLAVDVIFPNDLLTLCLEKFAVIAPHTRLELVESVLSGTTDMLVSGQADIVLSGIVPQGFLGESLLDVEFIPVARHDHPLHQLGRPLDNKDLKLHRQIVIRDSGKRRIDAGWLGSEARWTVGHMSTSKRLLAHGLGFAWLPRSHIQKELESGLLQPLIVKPEDRRNIPVYMIFAEDFAGPATQSMAEVIRTCCKTQEDFGG